MTDKPLDPKRQRLIGALYGELSPAEKALFAADLAEDEDLRRDFDELQTTRRFLGQAFDKEQEAGRPATASPASLGGTTGHGRSGGMGRWRWALAAGGGFAAAAAVFLVLLVAGLRVDTTGRGLLLRFGAGAEDDGGPASYPVRRTSTLPPADPWRKAPLYVGGPPEEGVTRAEFAASMQLLSELTLRRLDALEARQATEQSIYSRGLYDALTARQDKQTNDLKAWIELAAFRAARSDGPPPTLKEVKP